MRTLQTTVKREGQGFVDQAVYAYSLPIPMVEAEVRRCYRPKYRSPWRAEMFHPRKEGVLERDMRRLFQRPPTRPLFSHYEFEPDFGRDEGLIKDGGSILIRHERIRLNWLKPDQRGVLMPR